MNFDSRIPTILELGFPEAALPTLKAYLELLWSSNEELNLISRKMTFDDLMDNHVIDCLLPLKYFPKDIKSAADFGSGGGLPAVIYAIAFPHVSYTAFEKSKLKQDFLKKCIAIAPNLKVEGEIPPKLGNIDLVTSRAFKPIDVILEFSRDYYKKSGKYFLLKARVEKVEEEMKDARKKFKEVKAEIIALKSPVLEVERHLVLI